MTKKEQTAAFSHADDFKTFLNAAKTEREAARKIVHIALAHGYKDLDKALKTGKPASSGLYFSKFQDKNVALVRVGSRPINKGLRIIASHLDSPRLDLKQCPVYEDMDMGLLKTHYYGGIRKYQWLCVSLALHGRIIKADGEILDITLGEKQDDPVFMISDLLPHLAGKLQESKKLSEAFEGEKLNLLAGSLPLGDDTIKERFKLGVLKHLHDAYGLVEEDFVSAELEAVPAACARDVGLDRSMVGAYGQDDKICAFAQLQAILSTPDPEYTAIALFYDKEEIGSEGSTGAQSTFLEHVVSNLLYLHKEPSQERAVRETFIRSRALSADVNAAMDPDFKEVHEKMNAAKLGHGVCITKFTGARGKSGSSDANAEFVGMVRQLFNKNKVVWQTGELGKIDQGGGGTLAKFLAEKGIQILDCGPGLLSMHAPMEISSKADLFMTIKGFQCFYE